MEEHKLTLFQRLNKVFSSEDYINSNNVANTTNTTSSEDDVVFTAHSKEEYDLKALQAKQSHLLAKLWKKASFDVTNKSIAGLNNIRMMYRDADLMDNFPEIGSALDIISEEVCFIPSSGMMVNITSKSERIKSILQDLFINRLSINTILPMICRATCKYGNQYMLLKIDMNNGVTGWKQLPVYEIERYEHGMDNPYSAAYVNLNNIDVDSDDSTKFVWVGQTEYTPYFNWQIAHFRLLYDNIFLPYGCSFLNKARRHFRMLSMMEDMMLIYRLERSIERRVFKINVGAIDEADVPSFVQSIANEFKRTPIIDPLTGQIDLRKNILSQQEDFFIPVRTPDEPNPIETLPAAKNLDAMDDIKFIQNKIFTALRIPKSFLNFEDAQGDGRNLSLLDVRFTRTVNRIQQALLMELNKIAIIHLYLLGFTDDLTNFNLSMNNPSTQMEALELENIAKKIQTAKDAISDSGNGIPLMSATHAWKQILHWSDKEIKENLEELRLEKALAAELERTGEIIKRTRIFDPVDNIYGEIGAQYSDNGGNGEEGPGGMGGPGGGGGFGGGIGGLDFGGGIGSEGDMPMDMAADEEGAMDMGGMAEEGGPEMGGPENSGPENSGPEPPMTDSVVRNKSKLMTETTNNIGNFFQQQLLKKLDEANADLTTQNLFATELYNKSFLINEEINNISKNLDSLSHNSQSELPSK